MSSASFSTIEGGKMCKHKHALKGKMIRGVQRRSSPDPRLIQIQLFLSAGKQSPSFHFSHGPATRATSTGETDAEKSMRGRERGTSMGKRTKSPSGSDAKCQDVSAFTAEPIAATPAGRPGREVVTRM